MTSPEKEDLNLSSDKEEMPRELIPPNRNLQQELDFMVQRHT